MYRLFWLIIRRLKSYIKSANTLSTDYLPQIERSITKCQIIFDIIKQLSGIIFITWQHTLFIFLH